MQTDIDRGIHLVVYYLKLVGYHDHVFLLKGVIPLVSQRLVGAWSKLFVSHGAFLMAVPHLLVWH